MKRFLSAIVLCLAFSTSAMARSSTDVLLHCWVDGDTIGSMQVAAIIMLSPSVETATLVDPYNNSQQGILTESEYFYTITIAKNTQFSKVGTIKISRFTGRFSSVWRYLTGGETLSKPEKLYGVCIHPKPNHHIF